MRVITFISRRSEAVIITASVAVWAKSDNTMADTAMDVVRALSWQADEAKAYFEN